MAQSTGLIFYFQNFYYAYFIYFRFPSFSLLFITIVVEIRTSYTPNRL